MWSSSWSLANAMLIHLVPTCMHQVVPGHPPLRPDSALLHQAILPLQSKVREEEEHPRKGKQNLEETRHSPEFHSCSKKQYISRFKLVGFQRILSEAISGWVAVYQSKNNVDMFRPRPFQSSR